MSDNASVEKWIKFAVPFWVHEYRNKSLEFLESRLKECNRNSETENIIGYYGDVLMYGGGKKGKAAECFNAVAEGLAILSMVCPGGVDFGDLHFEYPHKDLKNG